MTGDDPTVDVEGILHDWLGESRPRLTEEALEAGLERARTTPRRLARRARAPWLLVAASIALVGSLVATVIAGIGAIDREARRISPDVAPPSMDPSALIGGPDAIAGTWYDAGDGDRPWVLRLARLATLQGPDTYVALDGWSVVGSQLRLDMPTGPCAGIVGSYGVDIEADVLRFTSVDDACLQRRGILRHWRRLQEGEGLADRFRRPFVYPILAGRTPYEASTQMHFFGGTAGVDQAEGLGIWIIERGYADRCGGSGDVSLASGVTGSLDYLDGLGEIELTTPIDVVVDGRPAVQVEATLAGDPCPAGKVRIWQDTGEAFGAPREDWFSILRGGRALITLVDVAGSTIAIVSWVDDDADPRTQDYADLLQGLRFLTPSDG